MTVGSDPHAHPGFVISEVELGEVATPRAATVFGKAQGWGLGGGEHGGLIDSLQGCLGVDAQRTVVQEYRVGARGMQEGHCHRQGSLGGHRRQFMGGGLCLCHHVPPSRSAL